MSHPRRATPDMTATATDGPRYATKRRGFDLLAMGAVLAVILVSAPALPVYSRVTVYDVRVVRVDAAGARAVIPTPRPLSRPSRLDLGKPDGVVAELERRIKHSMRTDSPFSSPGASYEWTIRWSQDSARLDRSKVLTRPGGAREPR